MEAVLLFFTSLGVVVAAELGDKTQLLTISFTTRYSRKAIFLGAMTGLGLVTVVGVVIGIALYASLPIFWIKILSAGIFIAFGLWTLLRRKKELEPEEVPEGKVFFRSLLLIALAEMGDKTQLAVISLTASSGLPLAVLAGALLGFVFVVGVGVMIGQEIGKRVGLRWIVLASGILFIVIGVVLAVEAML
ncbi:MAG: TMEM165/GDT1 family protein [Thermoplasmata archaeon]